MEEEGREGGRGKGEKRECEGWREGGREGVSQGWRGREGEQKQGELHVYT